MDGFKGVLEYFWSGGNEEEEDNSSSSLDVLAEVASKKRPRKRQQQPRIVSKKGELPVDLANKGIVRMLDISKVRFGIDAQRSVLHVFFDRGEQRKRSRTSGRFEAREEEYPYLGDSVEELAQHVKMQEIPDICTLAAIYPVGFWNAVYLIGKDLDEMREKLF
jgi:hypothetical protein